MNRRSFFKMLPFLGGACVYKKSIYNLLFKKQPRLLSEMLCNVKPMCQPSGKIHYMDLFYRGDKVYYKDMLPKGDKC